MVEYVLQFFWDIGYAVIGLYPAPLNNALCDSPDLIYLLTMQEEIVGFEVCVIALIMCGKLVRKVRNGGGIRSLSYGQEKERSLLTAGAGAGGQTATSARHETSSPVSSAVSSAEKKEENEEKKEAVSEETGDISKNRFCLTVLNMHMTMTRIFLEIQMAGGVDAAPDKVRELYNEIPLQRLQIGFRMLVELSEKDGPDKDLLEARDRLREMRDALYPEPKKPEKAEKEEQTVDYDDSWSDYSFGSCDDFDRGARYDDDDSGGYYEPEPDPEPPVYHNWYADRGEVVEDSQGNTTDYNGRSYSDYRY
ncbi:MAG: hypothetical protein LIV11_11845 [Bacillota bacterium]|nr:hypothetical protein [Bacillota bacterium]